MDLSRSGIPLSIRSLFPWGREHLCYPRYNPAITGECCPKANPGPRVIIHRDYRAHRIPAEIFFAVTEGARTASLFSSSHLDSIEPVDFEFYSLFPQTLVYPVSIPVYFSSDSLVCKDRAESFGDSDLISF